MFASMVCCHAKTVVSLASVIVAAENDYLNWQQLFILFSSPESICQKATITKV